jgi:hypothetical protein
MTKYGNKLFYLMQVGQEASSQFTLSRCGFLPNLDAKSAKVHVFDQSVDQDVMSLPVVGVHSTINWAP